MYVENNTDDGGSNSFLFDDFSISTITVTGLNDVGGEYNGYLKQNIPNPSSTETIITYSVPAQWKAAKANIIITDATGRTISKLTAITAGDGTVTYNTAALTHGIYNYSLVVDGKVINTKRMAVN